MKKSLLDKMDDRLEHIERVKNAQEDREFFREIRKSRKKLRDKDPRWCVVKYA